MRVLVVILLAALSACNDRQTAKNGDFDRDEHSAWVLDDLWRQDVLAEFERRGIPYEIKEYAGKTNLFWRKRNDTAVSEIETQIFGQKPPPGRHISFVDEVNYARFQAEFEILGIESHVYHHLGPYGELKYLYWAEEDSERVVSVLESNGFRLYATAEVSEMERRVR